MLATLPATGSTFDDLQSFVAASQEVDDWRQIDGANWDLEIGAITEATAELIPEPPLLIFDNIVGYSTGQRVVSLPIASYKRAALALGLPIDKPKMELMRMASRMVTEAKPIPPEFVRSGPVMDNVFQGADVDVFKFPVPRYHASDGGRYIGTGDVLINRDPESDFVNVGTYRMQAHEGDLLGLWMSPGQHGRQIAQRYWDRGQACPVAATFGGDPLLFMAAHTKFPWGSQELGLAGGLRGRPVEVIEGPITGLPIPAHAEIAIEGEIPPPSEQARDEGPFGEWPGYYSGGTRGTGEAQPVIRVKALYHRDRAILLNEAPLWPGAVKHGLPISAGVLWDQLEAAGIQDIAGVWQHTSYMVVVAIRQRYAGHAKQTGMAVLACASAARNGRYVVVVDEDIDPSDLKEVLWAMETRVDPASDIQLVDGCWSTPLDPRMPPDKRDSKDHTNSRAIFYAVRPFTWKEKFPQVSRTPRELRRQIVEKYRDILPFPRI